jgi:putative pyruvate formate lyase activating enzyme
MVDVDIAADEPVLWLCHREAMERLDAGIRGDGSVSLLQLKAELARRLLRPCRLCERRCKVDRLAGKTGYCGVDKSRVSNRFVHMGEEPDLIPSYTIFFSGCTFECLFCQNWDISQRGAGTTLQASAVARDIDEHFGDVRNINWVGGEPTPNLPFILDVLTMAREPTPQIWNSNMYMTKETMALLDGVVDVYLADFKWGPRDCSRKYSRVHNYWKIVTRNHVLANEKTEIVLRHLVMPGHVACCSRPVLEWVSDNLDKSKVVVNVMDQYRPEYKASGIPGLDRRISESEFLEAYKLARNLGLEIT